MFQQRWSASVQGRVRQLSLVSLWWKFWQLWAGVLSGRYGRSRRVGGVVVIGTTSYNPGRGCWRRSAGRVEVSARLPVPILIPVKAAPLWRWLKIKRIVHKDLRRSGRYGWRRVRQWIPWRRWRRTVQRPVRGSTQCRNPRQPGGNSWRAIRNTGTQLQICQV